MGRSEHCGKWAVLEMLVYHILGFPGSCPRAYGHPGHWERTIPAVVHMYTAKVRIIADSRS